MTKPDPKPDQAAPPLRVHPEPPVYRWDFWAKDALSRGLAPELAILGRAVIRETDQHGWHGPAARLAEEGIVEELTTRSPELAKRLYEILLETDGLRFAWVENETSSEVIELPTLHC